MSDPLLSELCAIWSVLDVFGLSLITDSPQAIYISTNIVVHGVSSVPALFPAPNDISSGPNARVSAILPST